jgi:hypothetical protein
MVDDYILTTKALGRDDAANVENDLDASNLIALDFAVLEYLKNWNYFQVTVNVSVISPRNQHLRTHRFQLSRFLIEQQRNLVFNQLISASPFEMWSRVVVRAQNNHGYNLHNSHVSDQQLYLSETSHDRLSSSRTYTITKKDVRAFSQYTMLWIDTMEQYKQDVNDNNWFCLEVPNRTWFITIYQK